MIIIKTERSEFLHLCLISIIDILYKSLTIKDLEYEGGISGVQMGFVYLQSTHLNVQTEAGVC